VASRRPRHGYPQPATHLGDLLDLLAIGIAIGLFVLVVLGSTGLPRALLTLAFTVFVPGRAIVTNLPWFDGWSRVAMSMVLSLSVISLFAAVSLWVHAWQPVRAFQAEAVASVIGLGCGVVLRNRLVDAALGRHHGGGGFASGTATQPPP
jgi:hypothetical protein